VQRVRARYCLAYAQWRAAEEALHQMAERDRVTGGNAQRQQQRALSCLPYRIACISFSFLINVNARVD